ncbi:MAG: SapC family protein [Novosphingobium sp.]|nr:SapC family protein [Novosphingobium sp.]
MSNHQIVNSAVHRDLRVLSGHGAALGDAVMACLTFPAEFRRVQGHFPIVFRRDLASGTFAVWALFGFEDGENLFLQGDAWDAPCKPLAQAIQPFLIGRGTGDTAQVHIDMDHPRVTGGGDAGVRLFDQDGQPSPYLESIAEMLGDLDQGHRDSPAFLAAIDRHGLLEPFSLDVPLDDGSRHSLVGFHAVNEERLAALDAAALGELNAAGHLLPLYMAVASLGRFGDLIARKNRRVAGG